MGGLVGTTLLTLVQYFVAPLMTGQRMDVLLPFNDRQGRLHTGRPELSGNRGRRDGIWERMSIRSVFLTSMALSGALIALFLLLVFASWNNQLELERRQRIHAGLGEFGRQCGEFYG